MGVIQLGIVGSKYVPQLGHDTVPFSFISSTTGIAASGFSSFCSFGTTLAARPLVRFGMIPLIAASVNTHPHGRRAMNGTVPESSLKDKGQTKGDRDGILFVVEAVGAVYSGFGKRLSVSRSCQSVINYLLTETIKPKEMAYLDAFEITTDPVAITILAPVQKELDDSIFVIHLPKRIQYDRSY